MGILTELLKEIPSNNNDEKLKMLCDRIKEEENTNDMPDFVSDFISSVNILLGMEVPTSKIHKKQKTKIYSVLTLERDFNNVYIIRLYTMADLSQVLMRETFKVTEITPEKILTEYAKRLKWMKGE